MKLLTYLMAAVALAMAAQAVEAQQYPARPIKFVMPYPAGTGPDAVMRIVGEQLTRTLKQQVLIENRPGGNGWIGVESVKRSPADGYTFLVVDQAIMSLHPYLYKKLTFDPVKDFDPVAPLFTASYFVTVAATSRWNSMADLIADGKSRSGTMSYGSSGVGGQLHLGGAMLESSTGIHMTHVPYKDVPQLYVDVSQGNLDFAFGTAATAGPLLNNKKIKFLAIASPERHPRFPDVPTIAESGGPADVHVSTWIAVFAPHGTPHALASRINEEIVRIMSDADVKERLMAMGFTAWAGTSKELGKVMQEDSREYGEFVKRVKISLD